ncbi:protein SODIUM POTASSIUM ROOT DEFECTIVE 2-like isoform X2 [Phragmites australis]|uniref:protein SODIUM POTASSIUM ROOT DEFECTIVE 2-like isoform X2 n=1 Tax=Phragmites australis TaxID=29695 RepID=UPI002D766386|nr:protein SODIUM POTASSIUM ROOT DEFECTIVE 2-like isoform X2 [Phragmites australis]
MHIGREVHMAARGFKRVSHWFPRSSTGRQEDDEDSNERNGLLRSHSDQIVPVADFGEEHKALALHVEPKTIALKVSMHCHGCARKVEKQISKLQGVVSFKVELEIKEVTVVGNVSPTEVLESICKVTKYAEILASP